MFDSLVTKISRKKLDECISKYESDGKTLEIGSWGEPSYSRFFLNRVGMDIKGGKGVDLVASAYDIPFEDNSFEIVLCLSVLEHLEDPKKALREMHRVLKPNGTILVSVPFMFPIHESPNDFWRFTKYGLKKLFEKGWEIIEIKAETNTTEFLAVILQRLGYQTNMRLNKISKLFIFIFARLIEFSPNMFKEVFGDIRKKNKELEAFTSAFFLSAIKK